MHRSHRDRAEIAQIAQSSTPTSPPCTPTWRRATPTGSGTATRAAPARCRRQIAQRSRRNRMLVARVARRSHEIAQRSHRDHTEIAQRSQQIASCRECRKVSWKSSMSFFAIAMRQLLVPKPGQSSCKRCHVSAFETRELRSKLDATRSLPHSSHGAGRAQASPKADSRTGEGLNLVLHFALRSA